MYFSGLITRLFWFRVSFFFTGRAIDWVAVSSTVIPLTEYRVSVGALKSEPNEYKRAYLRHKKLTALAKVKLEKEGGSRVIARVQQDPDTLITGGWLTPYLAD